MKVRIFAIALLAVLLLAAGATAQNYGGQRGPGMMMRPWQDTAKELGLSQSQIEQITQIAIKYDAAQMAAMQSTDTPATKQKTQMDIRTKAEADVTAVLTADQVTKAGASFAQMVLRDQAIRLKAALNQLNLSSTQQTAIDATVKDNDAKLKAINDDKTLDPQTRRQKSMEQRNALITQIDAQLTADQQAKFKILMPMGRPGGMRPGGMRGPGGPRPMPAPESAPEPAPAQ